MYFKYVFQLLVFQLLHNTVYFSFALAGHRGTCLRPLHIFALLCLCFAIVYSLVYCFAVLLKLNVLLLYYIILLFFTTVETDGNDSYQ